MNNKKIDQYYDYFDKAAMYIYDEVKKDYLRCLLIAGERLLGYENDKLSIDLVRKLNDLYQDLENITFKNEEIRQALQLLIVKGFKHLQSYPLDLMTPDSIAYLFSLLINGLYDDHITILDIALGTGNLINAISNNYQFTSSLIGIEKDELLVRIAKMSSELQNNEIKIYYNNCLDPIYEKADIIVGDVDSYFFENQYFPYLAINKFINNLSARGIFIYLINNNFFMQEGNKQFKEQFCGTFLGLIVLPPTMFAKDHIGKSILIGTSKKIDTYDMLIINMPSLSDKEKVSQTVNYIKAWTKKLKGMIL